MADIKSFLDKIKSAQYGRDVRQAIHDAISRCYEDGKAGASDLEARDRITTILNRIDKGLVQAGQPFRSIETIGSFILHTIKRMPVESLWTFSIFFEEGPVKAGRLDIFFTYEIRKANFVAIIELTGDNGYVLRKTGSVARSAAIDEMTFTEWEWENPPLEVGTTYLTTERYQGSPVYARLVRFEAEMLPTDKGSTQGQSFVVPDRTTVPEIISVSGMCHEYSGDPSGSYHYPIFDASLARLQTSVFLETDEELGSQWYVGVSVTPLIDNFTAQVEYIDVIVKFVQ